MVSIKNNSGRKYLRAVFSCVEKDKFVEVDIYEILKAYDVTCPATQHAVKKLLMAGRRGPKDKIDDFIEAKDSIDRAISLERIAEVRSDVEMDEEEEEAGPGKKGIPKSAVKPSAPQKKQVKEMEEEEDG